MISCLDSSAQWLFRKRFRKQPMQCSEWVPSEWESKQLKKISKSKYEFINHNASSSGKVHPLLSSHIKIQQCICLELFSLVNCACSAHIYLLIQTCFFFHWRNNMERGIVFSANFHFWVNYSIKTKQPTVWMTQCWALW